MTHAECYRRLAERAERTAQKLEAKGMDPRPTRALALAMMIASRAYGGGDFPDHSMNPMPDVDPNPGRPPFEEPRMPPPQPPPAPLLPSPPVQPPVQPPKPPQKPILKAPPSDRRTRH